MHNTEIQFARTDSVDVVNRAASRFNGTTNVVIFTILVH
ncbi:Uncharacterised protein [Vibrio cholerae]|nr:Uncharacterised protein [Vibrio cholerae]